MGSIRLRCYAFGTSSSCGSIATQSSDPHVRVGFVEYRRGMPELVLHDRPIPTVFDLLGHDENHMTASLGWALAHNAALLDRFVERVAPGVSLTEPPAIELQKHDRADGGFTDIELLAPELHVIVEAKIGWQSTRHWWGALMHDPSGGRPVRAEPLARPTRLIPSSTTSGAGCPARKLIQLGAMPAIPAGRRRPPTWDADRRSRRRANDAPFKDSTACFAAPSGPPA